MVHLSDDIVAQFIARSLSEPERIAALTHLSACAPCRQLISELARGEDVARTDIDAAGNGDPEQLAPDAVVDERYRVVRFIAAGGMGEVYEADDLVLNVRIALKTIQQHIAGVPRIRERFKREISLARRVTHPNVCRIFDIGFHVSATGHRVTFLTMEFLRR